MTQTNDASVPDSFLDHTDQRYANDPAERFRELRTKCPVAHSDKFGGFWILSNYEDIVEATRNTKVFTSASGVSLPHFQAGLPLFPLEADPPVHGHYRRLLQREFARGRMAAAEQYIRDLTNELIDEFEARGSADLIAELAAPLPAIVIARLMGFPREDQALFRKWLDIMNDSSISGGHEAGAAAAVAFLAHLGAVLADRRANPRDDMLSRIVHAEFDGVPITEEQAIGTTWTTVVAGHETTVGGIGSMLMRIAGDPSAKARIASDPSAMASAIEETIRLDSPIQGMGRTLASDVCVQGQQLRAGDEVWLNFAAANRDESHFPDPESFQVDRSPNHHLGFGDGIHRCVGAPLAQLEMRVVLEEVLRRIPDFRLAPGAVPQYWTSQARKLVSLPMVW